MRYVAPRVMWRPTGKDLVFVVLGRAGRHIRKRLEGSQEGHQRAILTPGFVLSAGFADVACREGVGLHL
jgi:hypothetical protein